MGTDIKEKVKALPTSPGVYIMKDQKGAVLYVGKAGNMRKRVSSYFYPNKRLYGRLESMVAQVCRIDHIPTISEAEALVYENSLIKQLKPKYNVLLRDDKSYPRLKLTINEEFPRLFITRKKLDDGALYYGPYTNGWLLKEALKELRRAFPLRTCGKMPKSPCLNYHLRQCMAPCSGAIDKAAYAEIVSELKLFLDKGRAGLLKALSEKMLEAAKAERFEEAARIRLRIEALSSMKKESVRYIPADESDELKKMLGLDVPLETIEAFDVSNIMGESAVGSMITFCRGRPRKSGYRKFRIKAVTGVDDYSMMREIVRRRYERVIEEKARLPDLILIDGGKGHLSAALEELERLGLGNIAVVGLAKPARLQEMSSRAGGESEHIYRKGVSEPLVLPRDSKALHLLERIRDEAHRFAIGYHKSLRSRKMGFSELDEVPGIGPKRKKALLERFGSVEKIKAADLGALLAVEGINEKSAKSLIAHFGGRPA